MSLLSVALSLPQGIAILPPSSDGKTANGDTTSVSRFGAPAGGFGRSGMVARWTSRNSTIG